MGMRINDIVHRLQKLPYDPEEYWILGGAARVMHGYERSIKGIELGCSSRMAD